MNKIFLTSDWHFNHDKDFIWQARGFNSVDEMNNEIIKRHNSVVAKDDDVYVLGDLCMGTDLIANKNLIEQLNGKIHIVLGNHDTNNRIGMYHSCKNIVEFCGYATLFKFKGYNFHFSHWPTDTSNDDSDKPIKARLINICGHSHATNKYADLIIGKYSYHVEMDANNCYPVLLDKIIEDLLFMNSQQK